MTSLTIELSPDRMTALVTGLPSGEKREETTREQVLEKLESLGVCHGIDEAAVDAFVETARSESDDLPASHVLLARGTPLVHGKDGVLRHLLTHGSRAGQLLEDGRIDSRRQHQGHDVQTGELLAELTAATTGTDGKTVCGESLPARPGKECRIQICENVQTSEDGLLFRAEIDGIYFFADACLRVVDSYEIREDVDFKTGDVETSHAVQIGGQVRSTFKVQAGGSVRVGGHIEDATVESGGSIEVAGGILRMRMGMVRAHESVRAKYALNAEIRAGTSIELADSAYHSHLLAGDSIRLLEGRGTIVGGQASATRSVELKTAGSKLGAPTLLRVGCELHSIEKVENTLFSLEQEISHLHTLLGTDPQGSEQGTSTRIRKLLRRLSVLEKRRAALLKQRERCLQNSARNSKGRPFIHVHDRIMSGVTLVIGEASRTIQEDAPGGRFTLNPENGEIEMG